MPTALPLPRWSQPEMFLTLALTALVAPADMTPKLYELRMYEPAMGKAEAMHARFRDHTLKLFARHGMTHVGYFVSIDPKDSRLFYIHASADAATASWKNFVADPDWQTAYKASEKDGKLVQNIIRMYMSPTDYSPPLPKADAKGERVFELRTYIASPKNLDNLNARFRNHTLKLFEKHGMTNLAYWNLMPTEKLTNEKLIQALAPVNQQSFDAPVGDAAAPNALVYWLAHASDEARKKSFDAFRMDPTWLAAREASEKNAGGVLTVKNGVKSLVLKPTDYSPMK
jgi:hypothetical protein